MLIIFVKFVKETGYFRENKIVWSLDDSRENEISRKWKTAFSFQP